MLNAAASGGNDVLRRRGGIDADFLALFI